MQEVLGGRGRGRGWFGEHEHAACGTRATHRYERKINMYRGLLTLMCMYLDMHTVIYIYICIYIYIYIYTHARIHSLTCVVRLHFVPQGPLGIHTGALPHFFKGPPRDGSSQRAVKTLMLHTMLIFRVCFATIIMSFDSHSIYMFGTRAGRRTGSSDDDLAGRRSFQECGGFRRVFPNLQKRLAQVSSFRGHVERACVFTNWFWASLQWLWLRGLDVVVSGPQARCSFQHHVHHRLSHHSHNCFI